MAAFVALAVSLAIVPNAAADCDFPIIPIRLVLPAAETVVVGDVTTVFDTYSRGFGYRFDVAVRSVLRGNVPTTVLKIRDLQASKCASFLPASNGQRIVLALHNTSDIPGWVDQSVAHDPISSIGYISGTPPLSMESNRISLSEVYRAAGEPLPATDATGFSRERLPTAPIWVLEVLAGVLLLAGAFKLRRMRRDG